MAFSQICKFGFNSPEEVRVIIHKNVVVVTTEPYQIVIFDVQNFLYRYFPLRLPVIPERIYNRVRKQGPDILVNFVSPVPVVGVEVIVNDDMTPIDYRQAG